MLCMFLYIYIFKYIYYETLIDNKKFSLDNKNNATVYQI